MKKFFKTKLITLVTILCVFSSFSLTALAAEDTLSEENISFANIAEYDLSSGKTQTFTLLDPDKNEYFVTIEPLTATSRVDAGSYKVSYSVPNYWTASFVITVSNNKIMNPRNLTVISDNIKVIITSKNLILNSFTLATCKLKYTITSTPHSDGFKAYISNNKLYTSRL